MAFRIRVLGPSILHPQVARPRQDPVLDDLIRSIKRADQPHAQRCFDIIERSITSGDFSRAESVANELDRQGRIRDYADIRPVLKTLLMRSGITHYQKFGNPSLAVLAAAAPYAVYTGLDMGNPTAITTGLITGAVLLAVAAVKLFRPRRISVLPKHKEMVLANRIINDPTYLQQQALRVHRMFFQHFNRGPYHLS